MVQTSARSPYANYRLRRSVLYMPASNQRALQKSKSLDADGVIFDLEDAVAPAAKVVARQQAIDAANAGGFGDREVVVRMNGLETPWGQDDLDAIAGSSADAVLIPKVESLTTVRQIEAALEGAGSANSQAIWCMLETPRGVMNAAEIAAASPRVTCLVMGTSDLANVLQAQPLPGREPMLTALSLCLLAARAHGRAILDGVHLDLQNAAGFEAACRQGLAFGFDGKTLIHPSQLPACNRIFAPSETEVAQAKKIITAFHAATAAGDGVVVIDGRLVENLHVENAMRVLAIADTIAARSGSDGEILSE